MRIALAADHAGFELKQQLGAYLTRQGHDVVDLGTHSTAPVDYPDSAEAVAQIKVQLEAAESRVRKQHTVEEGQETRPEAL